MKHEYLLKDSAKLIYDDSDNVFVIYLDQPHEWRWSQIGYSFKENDFSLSLAKTYLEADLLLFESKFIRYVISLFP